MCVIGCRVILSSLIGCCNIFSFVIDSSKQWYYRLRNAKIKGVQLGANQIAGTIAKMKRVNNVEINKNTTIELKQYYIFLDIVLKQALV